MTRIVSLLFTHYGLEIPAGAKKSVYDYDDLVFYYKKR